ncbi:MAG: M15 family metallopeptidase [Pseudomonadota bacterium]
MSFQESYRDQLFTVTDPDSRLRDPNNLMAFLRWKAGDAIPNGKAVGDFKTIPVSTIVSVPEIAFQAISSKSRAVFARVNDANSGVEIGWTSTVNFKDRFRNVTLGKQEPAAGAGQYAETAVWIKGHYKGQVPLILIMDRTREIERLTEPTAVPYLKMIKAAKADGVSLYLNSGFRTYGEQKYLYEGYKAGKAGFNKAAKPGTSNHQNGIAVDISVSGGTGSPQYDWLAKNGTSFGFIRTVTGEPWHWEYLNTLAAKAKAKGVHRSWDL